MLPKTPKPAIWKFIKGSAKTLFVLEAVCFAASYGLYYRMNTDQGGCHKMLYISLFQLITSASLKDFRRYINEKYPFALDYYYKIGELVGDSTARQKDSISWSSQAVEFAKK